MNWPEQRAALEAFRNALMREGHNLSKWPRLLGQQLFNRVRWEGGEAGTHLGALFDSRRDSSAAPWIELREPFRESATLVRTLSGHASRVTCCAWSDDGTFIVSGSRDKTLRIWDVRTGLERTMPMVCDDEITHCAVTRVAIIAVSQSMYDGGLHSKLVGLDSRDFSRRWSLDPGLESDEEITAITASFEPASLVLGTGLTLREWMPGSDQLKPLGVTIDRRTPTAAFMVCAVTPSSTHVATGHGDGRVRAWDLRSRRSVLNVAGHASYVSAVAISPDAHFVVSASDNTLKIWDIASREERATLTGHSRRVRDCAVSPDGSFVVSASDDNTLKIWDSATGLELATLVGHTEGVAACAVSPDGTLIVSASDDKTLKLWKARQDRAAAKRPHEGHANCCAFTADGHSLISGGDDRTLKVWDSGNGSLLAARECPGEVRACAASPDGRFAVAACHAELAMWDEAWTVQPPFRLSAGRAERCAIGPDASFVLAAGGRPGYHDKSLTVWDTASRRELVLLANKPEINACVIAPDGQHVVVALKEALRVYDVATGRKLNGWKTSHAIRRLALGPDGSILACDGRRSQIDLRDAATLEKIGVLEGHSDFVWALAFTPDGRYLISGGLDMTLRVWDVAARAELAVIPLLGQILCVAAHPWIPKVACGDWGGNIYRLDLIGLPYGPIVVTALAGIFGTMLRCPACMHQFPLDKAWLGRDDRCPNVNCGLPIRVNRFVVRPPSWPWRDEDE